jgi:hypothetical protein
LTTIRGAGLRRPRGIPSEGTTQNNLGTVLQELGTRSSGQESARYLKEAIAAYENALSIFTPEADPYRYETARRNLEAARRENQVASPKNPR